MPAGGGERFRITDLDDAAISWSPDGTQVLFNTNRDDDTEMYVVDADCSGETRLTNALGAAGFRRWSSDGRRILFMSERSGAVGFYVMEAAAGGVTAVLPESDVATVWFDGLDWHTWATAAPSPQRPPTHLAPRAGPACRNPR